MWISRNPIGYSGGDNLYAYVADDPIMLTDALGYAIYIVPSTDDRCYERIANALLQMCPCVSLTASLEDRANRLKAVVSDGIKDEDSFCNCVQQHTAGCSLVHDLLMGDFERNSLTIRCTSTQAGNHYYPDKRLITWNPNDSILVLVHEMAHAWDYQWVQDKKGQWHRRVSVSQLMSRSTSTTARLGECHAVQTENQVGLEIYQSYHVDYTYVESTGARRVRRLVPVDRYFYQVSKKKLPLSGLVSLTRVGDETVYGT